MGEILPFPSRKEAREMGLAMYSLSITDYRGSNHTRREYELKELTDSDDDTSAHVYSERTEKKLAKRFVASLPVGTGFIIDTTTDTSTDPTGIYGDFDMSSRHDKPSDRTLACFHRHLDRELRKKKDGWRGVFMHYKIRFMNWFEPFADSIFY